MSSAKLTSLAHFINREKQMNAPKQLMSEMQHAHNQWNRTMATATPTISTTVTLPHMYSLILLNTARLSTPLIHKGAIVPRKFLKTFKITRVLKH